MPVESALHRRIQKFITHYRPRDCRWDRIFLAMRKNSNGEYPPLTGSGVNQLLATLTAVVGIKKRVYPHLLRHSFGTYCLQRGMNPIQVAEIMGHSSLRMITNVYAHLTPQDAHAAMMKVLLTSEGGRR